MPAKIDTDAGEARDERELRTSGNSTVVTIAPGVLQAAGLECGDAVEVSASFEGGEITVKAATADEN